jgi:hypothetical protein
MGVTILPKKFYDNFEELIAVQRLMAGKGINDYTNSPGPKTLLKGDTQAGHYGFVQPASMGNFADGKGFNGANLALALGLASGTSFNPNVPLMKFSYRGKTLFIPLTGYRHSVSWDAIYNAGIAYDATDEGFLPPAGRVGTDLFIDSTDNSINCTNQNFLGDKTSGMDYADTVGAVNDTLILKGWSNEDNNTTVTITEITNTKIKVSGATLVSEQGGKKARFYKESAKVTQGKTISIGTKTYRVYLMKGAGNDPTDSYRDSDRGAEGPDNMWNSLILPLHEHAKIGNWNYPAYAVDANGDIITSDWNIGLTDENLRTHNQYGSGSYTWCQEVQDNTTWRRVGRGNGGASLLYSISSWYVFSNVCWRPVLEAL